MKPINEQISPKFTNHAQMLSQYSILLRKILPVECFNHVQVANIRDQNLMLITDSPVWTTKLRQLSPQILQALRENPILPASQTQAQTKKQPIIHHVQISTRYQHSQHNADSALDFADAKRKNKPRPSISSHTAEMLAQSANSISHQQLKTALLNIAAHASPTIGKKHD